EAIRQMAEAAGGEITAEMDPLLSRLATLSREAEALALTQAAVTSALDAFGRNLGDVGRLLSQSITFRGGQLGFNASTFYAGAISLVADALFDALSPQERVARILEDVAQTMREVARQWREFLSDAPFHELADQLEMFKSSPPREPTLANSVTGLLT